jgi:hypothetical protein
MEILNLIIANIDLQKKLPKQYIDAHAKVEITSKKVISVCQEIYSV